MRGGSEADHRRRVEEFYDHWSEPFIRGYGTTFQAGLLKESASAVEDPTASALLLARRAGIADGDRVLDAGCGVGGPAIAIAKAYSHTTIHGVTISGIQAEIAHQLTFDQAVSDRVVIVRADYHHLPFPDDHFDVVVFLESCGYSPDRAALFSEAARVVRPGGYVYVKDVFARTGPLTEEEAQALGAFDELWRLAASPTIAEVTSALERTGCTILGAGPLSHVGNSRFVAAMFEPDPDTLIRPTELGRAFAGCGPVPTFFGEVLARRQ